MIFSKKSIAYKNLVSMSHHFRWIHFQYVLFQHGQKRYESQNSAIFDGTLWHWRHPEYLHSCAVRWRGNRDETGGKCRVVNCILSLNLLPFLLLLREKICDFILLYAMKMIVNRRRLNFFGRWRMPKNLGIKPLFGRIWGMKKVLFICHGGIIMAVSTIQSK